MNIIQFKKFRQFTRIHHHERSYISGNGSPYLNDLYNTRSNGREPIIIYDKILNNGVRPSLSILLAALKACSTSRNQLAGMRIHANVIVNGQDLEIFVGNSLIHMYAKCGSRLDACYVFDRMPHRDLVSWNAVIFGYAESRECELAIELFECMQNEGYTPDARTFVAALKACVSCVTKGKQADRELLRIQCLEKGISIHSQLAKTSHEFELFVANTLVDMYAKSRSMAHACQVFYKMPQHDTVSWNAMIYGYIEIAENKLALELFAQMQENGFLPDERAYVAALKACAGCTADKVANKAECLEMGISIHSHLAKGGYGLNLFVACALVDMYAKCGSMVHARWVFDRTPHPDVVLWSTLIFGYAESGESELALKLFSYMQAEGFAPDERTYVAALKACASCSAKEEGKQVDGNLIKIECLKKGLDLHSKLANSGFESDVFVLSTLVDMYAKCGSMDRARQVFDRMPYHDVVSWSAVIFGYSEKGESSLALQLFMRMQDDGFVPDAITYVAALKACGNLGALETGKKIHIQICNAGFIDDIVVANCLVGFYGKCGSMVDAELVFKSMHSKGSVAWNALLAGYAHQGDLKHVSGLFRRMQKECFEIDGITFLSVLTACSHAGRVDDGKKYFQTMCLAYMITPSIEHYICIVDLLGRANQLDDALGVAMNMPFEPDLMMWKTLLGACRKWRNVVVGKIAFESILRLDNKDASAYVLMAGCYEASGI